jgi:alkylation response protein AidB-like acyl-CoA dehydrogenase
MANVDIDQFRKEARAWLEEHAELKRGDEPDEVVWGVGSDSTAIFHALSFADEQALVQRACDWQRIKYDAGYGAITWPERFGGAGLTPAHARAFRKEESAFETPGGHEVFGVTVSLVATTIQVHGTEAQQDRLIAPFLRTDELCSQLFSEPGAGSDLASLATRAVRDGDEWVLNGQKVWSSGAQFAQWGIAIVRTDPEVPKHKGLTAFMVPLDTPGVEVRPIRQMSGGSSFNEVFLTDARVPDALRLGAVGEGWRVALTTLGFERGGGGDGGGSSSGGSWAQVIALANHLDRTTDARDRQALARLYTHQRLQQLNALRTAARARAGQTPGPEGSTGRLMWTQGLTLMAEVVAGLLGPSLAADTGEWGTFAWTEHVTGAPGYRIAGGSEEIQRNIIGERVLQLPLEPRVDRDVAWKDVPR